MQSLESNWIRYSYSRLHRDSLELKVSNYLCALLNVALQLKNKGI